MSKGFRSWYYGLSYGHQRSIRKRVAAILDTYDVNLGEPTLPPKCHVTKHGHVVRFYWHDRKKHFFAFRYDVNAATPLLLIYGGVWDVRASRKLRDV